MTSQITSSNIDGTFPVAGQDNPSQGFRDNFTNIKNNFTYAASEISDLQSKALLKSALTGTTLNNDMQGATINNATALSFRETVYDFGSVSGNQNIDFTQANYQTITLAGSVTFAFTNFATTTGTHARVRIRLVVPNVLYTVTWPSSVDATDLSTISGAVGTLLTFSNAGTYIFEIGTINGGTSFYIIDMSRARDIIPGGNLQVITSVSNVATAGVTLTATNIGGVVVGNVYATNFFGNIITTSPNSASFVGNVTAGNIVANTGIYGNILTPIQSNITLLGTLSSLSVSGNANVGNLIVSGTTDFCAAYQETGIQYLGNIGTGGSTNIYGNVSLVIVAPNAAIASYTLVMPSAPLNGQIVRIVFANTITTLNQTAGAATIKGTYTTANANVGGQWVYYTPTTTWYKLSGT
jgi:hypothetical protein